MAGGTELLFEELLLEKAFGSEIVIKTAVIESYSEIENMVTFKNELFHKFTNAAAIYRRVFLQTSDYTEYLTKSGTLEFVAPPEQGMTHKFGKKSYWLMGGFISSTDASILIKGIYPNTVWAANVVTIQDEILGPDEGRKNQRYYFYWAVFLH